MAKTNAYGELNPLYPTYHDKEVELDELMRFFKFSYKASSGYSGTAVFEILDKEETYYMTIRADPENGVSVFRDIPNDKEISFHCILPYDTFHDVFWGYITAKTLVMGGGCKIKNWSYRAAFNFGMSFNMTSTKWIQYYQSGNSIKQMINSMNSMNSMNTERNIINKTIIPKSAEDTEFMYQWEPIMDNNNNNNNNISPLKLWGYKIKTASSMFMQHTMNEYYDWYSQYTRNRIGAISSSFINNSFNKFTSLIHKQTADNEVFVTYN